MLTSRPRCALYLTLPLLLAAGLLGGGCQSKFSDKDIQIIRLPDVRRMTDSGTALLLDARSPNEYEAEHIRGARSVPMSAVSGDSDQLRPELADAKNLIVYGNDPGSGVAKGLTKRLMDARGGRKGVWWYQGGLREWRRQGLPTDWTGTDASPSQGAQ